MTPANAWIGERDGYHQARTTGRSEGLSGKPYKVRVVKFGGHAEVFLNGNRIFYGPIPTDSPFQLDYNVTGSQATVEFEAVELIAKP